MARKKAPPGKIERLHVLFDTTLGRVLVRATLAALVFLLAGIVMRQARAYTYRMDDFRVTPRKVQLAELPAWADRRLQYELQPGHFPRFSVSIYDPEAQDKIRRALTSHPLVQDLQDLRVLYPNTARCTPMLRVPVARVLLWADGHDRRQRRAWRLLSNDGCLLPTAPYAAYLERLPVKLPYVTGITEPLPRRDGVVWEDRMDRVAEAVACARLAQRLYRDFNGQVHVTLIDVERFTPRGERRANGEVRLQLSCPPDEPRGRRVLRTVEWGRSERAARDVPEEDSYQHKVQRLSHVLTGRRIPRDIDVRHNLTVSVRTAE